MLNIDVSSIAKCQNRCLCVLKAYEGCVNLPMFKIDAFSGFDLYILCMRVFVRMVSVSDLGVPAYPKRVISCSKKVVYFRF